MICGSLRLPGASNVKVISRSPVFSTLRHLAIRGGELRIEFIECIERENNVIRRDRLAVMPFCFRPQPKCGRGEIVRIAHRLGKQSIFARYFVKRRHEQRLVDEIDALDERAFDAGDRHIEVVEGTERDLARRAAFRRFRIDVVELLETGRIFQVAEQRYAVPPDQTCCFFLRFGAARPSGQRKPPRGGHKQSGLEQGPAIYLILQ